MSTGKRVAPDLPEDDRLKRQDEAHRLWSRGWSHRAIAAEMKLDIQQRSAAQAGSLDRRRVMEAVEELAPRARWPGSGRGSRAQTWTGSGGRLGASKKNRARVLTG